MNTINRKSFQIDKRIVWEAWKLVKENAGSAGIDNQTLAEYQVDLSNNLYKLWNRLSSGSYFPPPVKGVAIPKKAGGMRILGIPSVSDRVAQAAIKMVFEPSVERSFLPDSYGYRPRKSAHDAIEVTKKRCWKYKWVLEFDIQGLFDNISHELLMKAVDLHTDCKWVKLYIERWLKAPMVMEDGSIVKRTKGTPQGGVISPVLSNLFLHYVFDLWMVRNFKELPWARYADDGLVHCWTYQQAVKIQNDLDKRLRECGLKLHTTKTSIVYCGKDKANKEFPREFVFLGFSFRMRPCRNKATGKLFTGFVPAISSQGLKAIRKTIKFGWRLQSKTYTHMEQLAEMFNPVIRGWILYYGRFYPSALQKLAIYINKRLIKWARRKYKKLGRHSRLAFGFLKRAFLAKPDLFEHWKYFKVY